MRAFLVTYEGSPRFQHAANELRKLGDYPCQLATGYDRNLTITSAFGVAVGATRHKSTDALGPGDICCYRSHLAVCRQIIALDLPWAHVFEDDAFFVTGELLNVVDRLLNQIKGNWGFVTLHHDQADEIPTLLWENDVIQAVTEKPLLMHGYTISRRSAEAILSHDAQHGQTGNWDIVSRHVAADLDCYRLKIPICGLDTTHGATSLRTASTIAPISLSELIGNRIVCLNLDRHPERWARMQRLQAALQLPQIKRHPATDGADLPKQGDRNMFEIACGIGHCEIWRSIIEDKRPWLILEDDVIFADCFQREWHRPRQLPAMDALYLGLMWPELELAHNGLSRILGCKGCFAYIVWPQGAQKLLDDVRQQGQFVSDQHPYNLLKANEFTAYVLRPSIAVAQWAESSISHRNPNVDARFGANVYAESLHGHVGGTPQWIETP